ncbi:MAG: TIGR00730 family Rossman fold protein [Pseudomonadota bacterium]
MRRICVFCGSRTGVDSVHAVAAREVGTMIGQRGIELVYGGGRVGLMGILADAAMAAGGSVIGIIPSSLHESEIGHDGINELIVVETMHERKQKMADLSDAFITLAGGAGTLEELFEQWTWAQLGFHGKPCGVLNINGYYTHMKAHVDFMVEQGFVSREHASILLFAETPGALIDAFATYQPPRRKW